MNHKLRFFTGMTLSVVVAAVTAGCGDDDSPGFIDGADAGDAGLGATSNPAQSSATTDGDSTPTVDESTSTLPDTSTAMGGESSDAGASSDPVGTESGADSGVTETGADSETTSDVTQPTSETSVGADSGVTESSAPGDSSSSDTSSPEAGTPTEDSDETSVDTTSDIASSGETSGETTDGTEPPFVDWVGVQVGQTEAAVVAIEETGNDGYFGVIFDAAGNFYAVGTATNGDSDTYMIVSKFFGDGTPDTSFGYGGTAGHNVSVGGTESVRAITIQTVDEQDYLVIAGTAQVDPNAEGLAAAEQDVAIVRFTMEGDLDNSFGEGGVVSLNLNTGIEGLDRSGNPAWISNETVWSLGVTLGDRLVIHGEQRTELTTVLGDGGVVERSDLDWVLVRLLADGSPDPSFSEDGKVTLDMAGAGATARSATILEDGSIVGSGYLTSELLGQSTQQPVLYKVDVNGAFDDSFANDDFWGGAGVFHDTVVAPPLRAEAYGAAMQGSGHFVTMGYGPTTGSGTGSDFIALRFTSDGEFDTSFGTEGKTYIDAAGQSDNGRSLVILPDESILGIGGGRTLPEGGTTAVSDGMLVHLTPDGTPIDAFGESGLRLYDLGGTSDFFWAGAVSPDQSSVVVVGLKGAVSDVDTDTDGAVLVLPLTSLVP